MSGSEVEKVQFNCLVSFFVRGLMRVWKMSWVWWLPWRRRMEGIDSVGVGKGFRVGYALR